MPATAFRSKTFELNSRRSGVLSRGWVANEPDIWKNAQRSGINIISTDKLYGSSFAQVCRGSPFCYTMLTFQYDSGAANPRVAVDSRRLASTLRVVEMHDNDKKLWFRFGTIRNAKVIEWDASATNFDSGVTPDVALSGDNVVEVHKSENNDGLWTRIGKRVFSSTSGTTVQWNGDAQKFDEGTNPAIAIYDVCIY